jgi:hypothetical protein
MKRLLSLVAVLAVGLAACGDPSSEPNPSNPDSAPEAILLSYSLAAGDEFKYEVGLEQHIEMSASGDPAMLAGEEIPGDASVDVAGTATFTHAVSEGPEPGTYEVHITGEFADVSVTGTVDGEQLDTSEMPEFAALEPIDVTVVVDEQGHIVHEGGAIEDPLAGALGGLGAMGGSGAPAPGLDPGQFIGPPLSDEEVTVGDTWTDEIETPGLGEDPIVTSITSTVTGVEELGGAEVLVIDSNATTSLIEFDLAEFFAGMFGAMAPEGASAEETAEFEAMMDQLRFLISVDGTTADSTTWFDAEAGVAQKSETTAATNISMDMSMPDEETGEMAGFVMDMTLDQDVTYRLISGPTA